MESSAVVTVRLFVVLALSFVTLPARADDAATAVVTDRAVRTIEVTVDHGYHPNEITVTAGERVRLRFVRHEYGGCSREVVFPALHIRRELPPEQPVLIELPALAVGRIEFACGMNMLHGVIVVRPR